MCELNQGGKPRFLKDLSAERGWPSTVHVTWESQKSGHVREGVMRPTHKLPRSNPRELASDGG